MSDVKTAISLFEKSANMLLKSATTILGLLELTLMSQRQAQDNPILDQMLKEVSNANAGVLYVDRASRANTENILKKYGVPYVYAGQFKDTSSVGFVIRHSDKAIIREAMNRTRIVSMYYSCNQYLAKMEHDLEKPLQVDNPDHTLLSSDEMDNYSHSSTYVVQHVNEDTSDLIYKYCEQNNLPISVSQEMDGAYSFYISQMDKDKFTQILNTVSYDLSGKHGEIYKAQMHFYEQQQSEVLSDISMGNKLYLISQADTLTTEKDGTLCIKENGTERKIEPGNPEYMNEVNRFTLKDSVLKLTEKEFKKIQSNNTLDKRIELAHSKGLPQLSEEDINAIALADTYRDKVNYEMSKRDGSQTTDIHRELDSVNFFMLNNTEREAFKKERTKLQSERDITSDVLEETEKISMTLRLTEPELSIDDIAYNEKLIEQTRDAELIENEKDIVSAPVISSEHEEHVTKTEEATTIEVNNE